MGIGGLGFLGHPGMGSVLLSIPKPQDLLKAQWTSDLSFCHLCGCSCADHMSSLLGVPTAPQLVRCHRCNIFKWFEPLFQICRMLGVLHM